MKTKIGVIGGTRGMGYWFARFLEKEGHAVRVCGRNVSEADIAEMADTCDVVVVSVPMGVTGNVIAKVGPHMRAASLLMDITSLKQDSVKSMLETSASEVIGCHPLFGPRVDSITGQRVVLCPARAGRWLSWLTDMFERNGAFVVETTPEKHDQMMAIIQGLNHFNTIMMGLVLSEAGVSLSELMKFATPVFRAKMEIMEKVFCQNTGLYADILAMNPEIRLHIDTYEENVAQLKNLICHGDSAGIADMIEKHASFFKVI
ncbi:MAG: prephenate dehydrogenase/arogenate dehydrogenase family protein [Syntrophales bacterium]|jgi:prephenate dehydrogenase